MCLATFAFLVLQDNIEIKWRQLLMDAINSYFAEKCLRQLSLTII